MKWLFCSIALPILFLLLISCDEKSTGPGVPGTDTVNKYAPPAFIRFSPDSGYANSTIALYFKNLPYFLKRNIMIYLGNIQIEQYTIYPDSIKFKFPTMAPGFVKFRIIIDSTKFEPEKLFFIKPSNSGEVTSFSPVSGFPGDIVTLYGKNLLSDSILSVTFNLNKAEILQLNDNFLKVKVPPMKSADVNININFKNGSKKFDNTFKILEDGINYFPVFNSIYFEFKNIKFSFREYGSTSDFPYGEQHDTTYILDDYKESFLLEDVLNYDSTIASSYMLQYQSPGWFLVADIRYTLDIENSVIKTFDLYGNRTLRYNDNEGYTEFKILRVIIKDMTYTYKNDSIFSILRGKELESKVDSIASFYEISRINLGDYSINNIEITKLMQFNDSSQVIIKIYRK